MNLKARLMRFLRGPDSDDPVRLHVSAPTVPTDMQTGLECQPVCILGQRWTVPKLIEEQPEYWEREPRQPVDFERLPAG